MIQTNGVVPADKGRMRKLIRQAAVEILKGKTLAGERVLPNATLPPWAEELPVIMVYPRTETATEYGVAPRELERELSLEIEIVAKGPEQNPDAQSPEGNEPSVEDILDDMAEAVEKLMSADETLGGTCSMSILSNTEMEFDSAGEMPIGSARLTYTVVYYTMSPRVEPTNPDFETNEVDYNLSDNENAVEATDTVDMDT